MEDTKADDNGLTDMNTVKQENGSYDNPTIEIEMVEEENETDTFDLDYIVKIPSSRKHSTLSKLSSGSDWTENGDVPAVSGLKKRQVSIQINVDDADNKATGTGPEPEAEAPLLYKVSDSPPVHLVLLFGFQQTLLSIAGSLIVPLLVAQSVCARTDGVLLTKLLSSTMIMNGITSLMQTLFGVRLPLFQGPSASYIVPLISLNQLDRSRCDPRILLPPGYNSSMNETSINMEDLRDQLVDIRLRELMGPLIVCGLIHFLVGFTGLVGVVMRFVGPITIVPTILLIGIYIVKPTLDYAAVHWGVAAFTWIVGVVLSLFLGSHPMPIPLYNRQRGWYILRYPLHQVFAILISVLLGWMLCGILTAADVFTDDPKNLEYSARTDAKNDLIKNSDWFYLPYPGQFGVPGFTLSAFIGFLIATVTSILDSIGDYYACAATCRVPPPPGHAVNRGIAVEGFCSMISGFMGTGHATTTYGGNIGAIGITKVASRSVFVSMSIIYLVFGVFAKLSAVFISIPYPVLGGCLITIVGVFVGVNLSNLQTVDLSSTRNLSIIGMGIFVGLLVPSWIEKNPEAINTGNSELDKALNIFLGNPNFIGSVLSCFLDNTIPGTAEERGIAAWRDDGEDKPPKNPQPQSDTAAVSATYTETIDVYNPLLPARVANSKLMKYLPAFPYKGDHKDQGIHIDRRPSTMSSVTSDIPPGLYEGRRSSVRRMSMGASLYL